MRYRLLSVVLAVALTAACSDTPESDPFAPVTASVTACQVNTVRQAAGRYFESGADGRTANDLVKALQQAPDLGVRRTAAFDLLALVAEVTDANRQAGTTQQGSDLVNAVLGCTGYGEPGLIDFVPALSEGGAFAVRGGATDPTAAVRARLASWGVEPADALTWPDVTAGLRVLIYGDTIGNFDSDEVVLGMGYEWSRIPAGEFAYPVAVGYCDLVEDRSLIQHYEDSNPDAVVLPPEELSFCSTPAALGGGLFAALSSGPGGRVKTFSPFAGVDAELVTLAFAQQPVTAKIGTLPTMTVLVTGAGGTPIEGVAVGMTVAGNSGSFNFGGTMVEVTDADGIATFDDLTLDKPGGYTLTATAQHWFFEQASTTSDLFNLSR